MSTKPTLLVPTRRITDELIGFGSGDDVCYTDTRGLEEVKKVVVGGWVREVGWMKVRVFPEREREIERGGGE